MDNKNRDRYRNLIEMKLNEVGGTIDMMKSNNEAEQNKYSPSELSNYDNHPAEMATELYQTELNSALKLHEKSIYSDLEDALERVNKGTYGQCIYCGEDIPEERLLILPHAKLCIKCKEEGERFLEKKPIVRSNEEEVIKSPFGREYLNKQEDDEHEGMDQLNDLMKYGSSDGPQDMGGYHDYEEFYTNEVDTQGIVDDMDRVSNNEYKKQLPD